MRRPKAIQRQIIEDLRELIVALDRRVPRLEHTGEADIARDAAMLKRDALKRIEELDGSANHSCGAALKGKPRPAANLA